MPARDRYHDTVKHALHKDGWTITHDPFRLEAGDRRVYVDLAAKRLLAAERADDRIAVEIKTFAGESDVRDLEQAIGQFVLYRFLMAQLEPGRQLLLAVTEDIYSSFFQEPIVRPIVEGLPLHLLVFSVAKEEVVKWIR